jgi:transcriptional regulator with XRE-family HTH domain
LADHFACNLQRLRFEKNLTEAALAASAGINSGQIVAIENDAANISLDVLERLADALGVSACELLNDPDRRSIEPTRIDVKPKASAATGRKPGLY